MATFTFQMTAALSERWLGQTSLGEVTMAQPFEVLSIKYAGDPRTIMRLATRWSNLSLLGHKETKPGARALRENGLGGWGEEMGKWWKGEKRARKEIKKRKGRVIENGVEGKE